MRMSITCNISCSPTKYVCALKKLKKIVIIPDFWLVVCMNYSSVYLESAKCINVNVKLLLMKTNKTSCCWISQTSQILSELLLMTRSVQEWGCGWGIRAERRRDRAATDGYGILEMQRVGNHTAVQRWERAGLQVCDRRVSSSGG